MDHEKTLADWVILEAANPDYDCPEAMLSACNEYYKLNLSDEAIAMMAGYGEGMFIHKTCGALLGAAAAMSALIYRAEQKGQSVDIEKAMQTLIANFKELNHMDSLHCEDIKPKNWDDQKRFVRTDLIAAQALQKTLAEFSLA